MRRNRVTVQRIDFDSHVRYTCYSAQILQNYFSAVSFIYPTRKQRVSKLYANKYIMYMYAYQC